MLIPITQDAHAHRRSSNTDMLGADWQEAEVAHSMAERTGKKKVVCRLIHQMSRTQSHHPRIIHHHDTSLTSYEMGMDTPLQDASMSILITQDGHLAQGYMTR